MIIIAIICLLGALAMPVMFILAAVSDHQISKHNKPWTWYDKYKAEHEQD
jgi:hypothetical protein